MTAIINNNLEYVIPITEFLYDELASQIYIKNKNISAWTKEIINFFRSLKNELITAITIKQGDRILHDYQNLSGHIASLNNESITQDFDIIFTNIYVSITIDP